MNTNDCFELSYDQYVRTLGKSNSDVTVDLIEITNESPVEIAGGSS